MLFFKWRCSFEFSYCVFCLSFPYPKMCILLFINISYCHQYIFIVRQYNVQKNMQVKQTVYLFISRVWLYTIPFFKLNFIYLMNIMLKVIWKKSFIVIQSAPLDICNMIWRSLCRKCNSLHYCLSHIRIKVHEPPSKKEKIIIISLIQRPLFIYQRTELTV